MGVGGAGRPPGEEAPAGGRDDDGGDIALSPDDRAELLAALAEAAADPKTIRMLLSMIVFPRSQLPLDGPTPLAMWSEVLHQLDAGVIPSPYRSLLTAARGQWKRHPILARLYDKYLVDEAPKPAPRADSRRARNGAAVPAAAPVAGNRAGPPTVSGADPQSPARSPRAGKRRRRQRLLIATGVAVALVLVACVMWVAIPSPGGSCEPAGGKGADGDAQLPRGGVVSTLTVGSAHYLVDPNDHVRASLALSFTGRRPSGYRAELFSRQVPNRENPHSMGASTAGDGYQDGDTIYRPVITVDKPRGCWRATVSLGGPGEVGLVFSMFVVLLDDEAYSTFVENWSAQPTPYAKDDIRDGPGDAKFISQFWIPTAS